MAKHHLAALGLALFATGAFAAAPATETAKAGVTTTTTTTTTETLVEGADTPLLPPAPAGVSRFDVTGGVNLLASNGKLDYVLPQTYVFDLRSGQPAALNELPPELARLVAGHRPTAVKGNAATGYTLDQMLAATQRADGSALTRAALGADKRFVLFQLWAGWCTGCMEEGTQLNALLKAHPMPGLAWIAMESDPMKPFKKSPAVERALGADSKITEH
jgi:thiol-disulfide isomerase/thioredoxin